MSLIYNATLAIADRTVKALSHGGPRSPRPKLRRFADGRRALPAELQAAAAAIDRSRPLAWLHCSSLGEYAIVRPLVEELRRRPEGWQTAVTFFSPSGYEVVHGSPGGPDHVLYLPIDSRGNVRRFLDALAPSMAVFAVSEYWYNFLQELRRRAIPTYLVSAKIGPDSIFCRPYGLLHRRCLPCYTHIFTVDDDSCARLARLGCRQASVAGNPLFDNAVERASRPWSHPVLDAFAPKGTPVFISGSVHDATDASLAAAVANARPGLKHIIVPHSLEPHALSQVTGPLDHDYALLSKATPAEAAGKRTLVVDTVGSLAYIYRYATLAYVGGGFTRQLHSVIEPVVYGLPVAFGPRTERKVTPARLESLGIGTRVSSVNELLAWIDDLIGDPARLSQTARAARAYIDTQAGAARHIINRMLEL